MSNSYFLFLNYYYLQSYSTQKPHLPVNDGKYLYTVINTLSFTNYEKKVLTVIINNSTNINKKNDHVCIFLFIDTPKMAITARQFML
jgi:hypothetical protein